MGTKSEADDLSMEENSVKILLTKDPEAFKLEKKQRCVSKIQIAWALISFVISVMDVFVILYLSYLHFSHSSDLIAWIMLGPILLNFIGMFTFLSNESERKEMESLGCKKGLTKNLMFFPVIGPAFSQLRLFFYTLQEPNAEHTERLESLLTRMKQYESFFRAAPEAFIQITYRIITWHAEVEFHAEDYWTNICIALCIFTLAESNMYGPVRSYYRMFHYDPQEVKEGKWKIDRIPYNWRVGLFFFSYFSIGSRIYADAIFKATASYYFKDQSFGEVIILAFLVQFVLRAILYAFFNSFASHQRKQKVTEEGVYGAFTYAWKSLFMSFDFASNTKCIFFWFYLETLLMIATSYIIMYAVGVDLSERYLYHVSAGTALVASALAIGLKTTLWYLWDKRIASHQTSKVSDTN